MTPANRPLCLYQLEEERSKRETLVKEYLAEITRLWDKLRVEEEEREEFMMSNVGLTMDVIRAVSDSGDFSILRQCATSSDTKELFV